MTATYNMTELSDYGWFLSCPIHVKQECKMFLWQAVQAINTNIFKVTFGCENIGVFLLRVCGQALILK